jgi:hypothetical protein
MGAIESGSRSRNEWMKWVRVEESQKAVPNELGAGRLTNSYMEYGVVQSIVQLNWTRLGRGRVPFRLFPYYTYGQHRVLLERMVSTTSEVQTSLSFYIITDRSLPERAISYCAAYSYLSLVKCFTS